MPELTTSNTNANCRRPVWWHSHGAREHWRYRRRSGRVQLLPAHLALVCRGGTCGQLGVSGGCEAVLTGSIDCIHRLWVLSGLASEKMPAPAPCDRLDTALGSCGVCGYLHLLSASNGKCLSQLAGPLIL